MSITVTLIVQGLAFLAVAWLVMRFGWPEIMAAIEACQKQIADGLAAADMLSSMMTLSGVLMALLRRKDSGRGDYIDMAMADALLAEDPLQVP